jgi:hypothetical protein
MPLRGAGAVLNRGLALERRTRAAVTTVAGQAAVDALDAALARLLSDDVVDRVLERVEAAGVAQRVAQRILEDGIAEQILERVIAGPELERMVGVAVNSEETQLALIRGLESKSVERLLDRLVRSPGSERIVSLLLDSPLPAEIVTGLLASEELWIFVDEIARSPSVTEAISHQSTGFAEEIADKARDRSRKADAWVERIARRVGRHRDDATDLDHERLPPAPLPDADSR